MVSDLEAPSLWREKQNETRPGKQEADGLSPWRAGNELSTKELLPSRAHQSSEPQANSPMPGADWERVYPVL